jgi:ribosome-associated protein
MVSAFHRTADPSVEQTEQIETMVLNGGSPMIQITPQIEIQDDELEFQFIRASGPGGQNVNKVASAVQLRFDVLGSPSLTPAVKTRLLRLAGSRATEAGEILIEARSQRTQVRNREEALERLRALIQAAATPPKARRKTRPGKASKERRLQNKKRRAEIKKKRGKLRDWSS